MKDVYTYILSDYTRYSGGVNRRYSNYCWRLLLRKIIVSPIRFGCVWLRCLILLTCLPAICTDGCLESGEYKFLAQQKSDMDCISVTE